MIDKMQVLDYILSYPEQAKRDYDSGQMNTETIELYELALRLKALSTEDKKKFITQLKKFTA